MPLLAKEGYADLFCFIEAPSKADVSTRNEPVGGLVKGKLLVSTGVGAPLPAS